MIHNTNRLFIIITASYFMSRKPLQPEVYICGWNFRCKKIRRKNIRCKIFLPHRTFAERSLRLTKFSPHGVFAVWIFRHMKFLRYGIFAVKLQLRGFFQHPRLWWLIHSFRSEEALAFKKFIHWRMGLDDRKKNTEILVLIFKLFLQTAIRTTNSLLGRYSLRACTFLANV